MVRRSLLGSIDQGPAGPAPHGPGTELRCVVPAFRAARPRGTPGSRRYSPITLAMMLRWMSLVPPKIVATIDGPICREIEYSLA